ncbi:MAG: Gfo/Idh/MocA family oxidoreductase, partial [Mariniphaga sp.]
MEQNESSRRSFLRKALTLSAVTALPTILTNSVSGIELPATKQVSAGEKVNLALCGIGNRGGEIAQALYDTGLCNIVALCDVDMGAPHTLKVMNKFPDAAKFQDFRVMFDKMGSKIDAVTAGVPDFAHFPIAMLAMSLGKGIYSEKPMGRTFNEVQLMMDAAKKYKVAN